MLNVLHGTIDAFIFKIALQTSKIFYAFYIATALVSFFFTFFEWFTKRVVFSLCT